MKVDQEAARADEWVPPETDFTPEERAALKELGWREGRGQFDPDWRPLRKRPRWLAFIYRTLHIGEI